MRRMRRSYVWCGWNKCSKMSRPEQFTKHIGLFLVIVCGANAAIYNNNLVIKLKGDTPNDYFGYAVALQGGNNPRVVIGAPKKGTNKAGAAFVCPAVDRDGISTKHCTTYTIDNQHIINTANAIQSNSLFGACIDGGIKQTDEIMIGAPKLTEASDVNYVTGGIFRLSELTRNKFIKLPEKAGPPTVQKPAALEYYSGFAQFGFALHYVNDSEWIYGAPDHSHFRGEAFRRIESDIQVVPEARTARQRKRKRERRALQETIQPMLRIKTDDNWLAGYAVTAGRFFDHTSYAIGMPHDNNMMGSVHFYKYNTKTTLIEQESVKETNSFSIGRPFGEFFGGALAAADVNGDGYDDLLVGAPNAQTGDDHDNGKVYLFLSNTQGDFKLHQELVGEPESKMGTAISNLGMITLDAHESVAIGCPYEDGVGAVRVYVWQDGKLTLDSKIQLTEFSSFGYSLSRAVDVDSNNIADLAVGAYKSNAIAILKAKSVFHYTVTSTYTKLYAEKDDTNLRVTFCYSLRGIPNSITTTIHMELDDRIDQSYVRSETLQISTEPFCKTHNFKLVPNTPRYEPLSANLYLTTTECDTCPVHSPTFPNFFKILIPFSFDCRGEICLPDLRIDAKLASPTVVVGEQDKHELSVNIKNKGDPAFVCKLDVTSIPHIAISVVNPKRCDNTVCQYNHIIKDLTQKYVLDFTNWNAYSENLDLTVTLECVNITTASKPSLKLQYKSKLEVTSVELTKQHDSLNASTHNVETAVIFHILNSGPSNLKETSYILRIPRFVDEEQIVDVYQPINNDFCKPISEEYDTIREYRPTETNAIPTSAGFGQSTGLPKTISCDDSSVRCMEIQCKVQSLVKGKLLVINVPIKLNTAEIMKHYRSTFTLQSSLTREEPFDEISIGQIIVVDRQTEIEGVAWWVIVVSILVGAIILAGIFFTSYKLGFFNRPKHEKLTEEMEMDKNMEAVGLRNAPAKEDNNEGEQSQQTKPTLEDIKE